MTDARRLLAEATPLPWEAGDIEPGAVLHNGSVSFRVLSVGNSDDAANETDLIVYAVNHLPDYLAAVGALERMVAISSAMTKPEAAYVAPVPDWYEGHKAGVAALARLREKVPA